MERLKIDAKDDVIGKWSARPRIARIRRMRARETDLDEYRSLFSLCLCKQTKNILSVDFSYNYIYI